MSDAVDMSLDDIIKQNRKSNRGKPRSGLNRQPNQAVRSKIRPKVQRRPITKTSPIKDKSTGTQLLHISNLHFNVSNQDLKQLFEEFGGLKKAAVHYDRSGRSLGTAEVTFFNRDAAVRAVKKYDQRHLDGRPMNIKLVPSKFEPGRIGVKSGSGIQKRSPQKVGRRPQQGQGKSPRKGGPIRKGGKPGNKRAAKPEVTAAQLDAELESYKDEKMSIE